jgi:hypothetical protein
MKYLKSDGTSEDIPQDNPAPPPVKLRRTGPDAPTNNTFEINISLEYTEIAPGIVVKAIDLLENPAGFRKHYKGKVVEWERFLWSVGKIFYNRLREDLQAANDKLEKKLFPEDVKASHLKSRLLVSQQVRNKSTQLEIFGKLDEETKTQIEKSEEPSLKIYGPAQTTGEHQLIDCICKLLHHKSENKNKNSEKYYAGNYFAEESDIAANKVEVSIKGSRPDDQIAPWLKFTPYELAKEYTGNRAPSGKDIEEVMKILHKLADRKYLWQYKYKLQDSSRGNARHRVVEYYKELLDIIKDRDIETDAKNLTQTITREEVLIRLHPIFRTNIATDFIINPDDMVSRTKIAAGGRQVDHAALQLRDLLQQAHSRKEYNPDMYLHKLYSIIAEPDRQRKNYPKCRKKLLEGIKLCKNLGLLEGWKEEPGTTGETLVTFALCREWI